MVFLHLMSKLQRPMLKLLEATSLVWLCQIAEARVLQSRSRNRHSTDCTFSVVEPHHLASCLMAYDAENKCLMFCL